MPQYRIYRLNAAGLIVTGSDVNCGTDEAAFSWAATRLGSNARAEIWQDTRLVGQLGDRVVRPHRSDVPPGPVDDVLGACSRPTRRDADGATAD